MSTIADFTPMHESDPWGKPRIGDWLQTRSGKKFFPLDPSPEDIDIEDIAHALSNQCRFTGHVKAYYSIAEHSVRVANYILDNYPGRLEDAFAGLMHDASEAYLSDLSRPIKQLPQFKFYRDVEDNLMRRIAERFEFEYPLSAIVHEADSSLLGTEARDLMSPVVDDWHLKYKLLDEKIDPWTSEYSKRLFLTHFRALDDLRRL